MKPYRQLDQATRARVDIEISGGYPPIMDLTTVAVAARIKRALKARSGINWSVTRGNGTACGWITIDAPASRRTMHCRLKPGATNSYPESYEDVDTGEAGGYMTPADQARLGMLLGLDGPVHIQGEMIPASSDYYEEYIDRAEGRTPRRYGRQYWD